LATALFADQNLQNTLIDNVIRNIEEKGYSALDVDFEFLGLENALLYADFVAKVRDRLSPLGVPVMAALAPKTSTTQRGVLYEGHNYSALGNAADALLLMTYEWGYTYGPPLAVSPIEQVEEVVKFAVTQIEPSKLYLGISNYGYNFVLPYVRGESKANSLSTADAFALAAEKGAEIQYDETAQAPFFNYTDEAGRAHTVWFEDVRSISARLELIKRYGLRGALYWNLNRRNNQNLVLIEQRVNPKEFTLV
ncbi:MAG: glycoside hydrolase, partial [Oscillospiraceae bacterium]|nr:glycoside hydrolase [Oscillospiraceae bacterium]